MTTGGCLADQLCGRTFLCSDLVGNDLVPGSTIRVEFGNEQRIHAYAGCNHLSGAAQWVGARMTIDELRSTEMACTRPLMDQDAWLANFLQSGPEASLDGDTLTLTGRGVRLRLVDRRTADPDRPLEETTWTLESVLVGSGPTRALSSVPQDVPATLVIADGRIRFFDGRHDYTGAVTVTTDTVLVEGQLVRSPVPPHTAAAESTDMSVLMQDFHYRIVAGRLTVTGAGDAGLEFAAVGAVR